MGTTDFIELHISGTKGGEALSKDNFDIKELRSVIDSVVRIFDSGNKKASVQLVSVEDGCVKYVFQSTVQAIKQVSVLFPLIISSPFLKEVDSDVAIAVEEIQEDAHKKGYSYRFVYSGENEFLITPETNYKRQAPEWAEAEFYLYGEIESAGGSSNINIHIRTDEYGLLIVNTDKGFLARRSDNFLFHTCGIHAIGRQNIVTGEIEKGSLRLVEILDYTPVYDKKYLDSLRDSVGDRWDGVNIDEYLSEVRAYA